MLKNKSFCKSPRKKTQKTKNEKTTQWKKGMYMQQLECFAPASDRLSQV